MTKINLTEKITLAPFDSVRKESLAWYQDETIQRFVNSTTESYSIERIQKMYDYQREHGELFYIEYSGQTVGDVWKTPDDFAIVLSPDVQHSGIGKIILKYFIHQQKLQDEKEFHVKEINKENIASLKLFEKFGFVVDGETENTVSVVLHLNK
jgi:L-amino acid N-acyltransferase YncA